ncbi:hypothetical protein EDB83DRAFT_2315082 [Lactarius deliciosus]|nr:hypothetical protein EDB83DRAFT_2315082 [Lactarius deliciosus]
MFSAFVQAADGEAADATCAPDAPTAMPSALDDTSPSTSTNPRLTLKLGPQPRPLTTAMASVAPAKGNISDTPPSSGSSSAAGPSGPSNVNIRLERAQLGAKKRKPDNKTLSASTKRQKTSSALAIPPDGNSIKNVCMHRWNKLQPGGQGLASDFEEYFKTLTDIDKEPFRKEMRAIQFANMPVLRLSGTTKGLRWLSMYIAQYNWSGAWLNMIELHIIKSIGIWRV